MLSLFSYTNCPLPSPNPDVFFHCSKISAIFVNRLTFFISFTSLELVIMDLEATHGETAMER